MTVLLQTLKRDARSWIRDTRHCGGDALDFDCVLPSIAEVIEVLQRFHAGILKDIDEASLAGIERSGGPVRIGYAPSHVSSLDLVGGYWSSPLLPGARGAGDTSRIARGTSIWRTTTGLTSSSVILMWATLLAVMPPDYVVSSSAPSSKATARPAWMPGDLRSERGRQQARRADRRHSIWR